MSLFSIWPRLGFRENPYSNQTLPPDEAGDRLLVGRDREVAELQRKIGSDGTHPSVEGPAGVGKSSLIAVAGYRMLTTCVREAAGALFLPARSFYQVAETLDSFEERVYYDLAQTLLTNVEAFRRANLPIPDLGGIDKWLNTPQYRHAGGTLTFAGANFGSEPNVSGGFSESGLPRAIQAELERCFPSPAAGGVVCVLDNLELLQSSQNARQVLEDLRDRLFTVPGLRWVLCGSRGIVSRARSQRLSGVFDAPMFLGPVPDDAAIELIRRRLEYYGEPGAYAPVEPEAFEYLYKALNLNLRDSLAYAQQFSDWVYANYVLPDANLPTTADKFGLLQAWLAELADQAHGDAKRIQRRVWQFFDDLATRGGTCRASEWEQYEFTTQQQLSSTITALADANLVARETDPDNAARSMTSVTPQGWLVRFHRARYDLPSR
ncbi:MAG: ATP-binding protein [Actinomycetota bacterium]|nr:ATP-binding protein [Actinomycetota bacterium]